MRQAFAQPPWQSESACHTRSCVRTPSKACGRRRSHMVKGHLLASVFRALWTDFLPGGILAEECNAVQGKFFSSIGRSAPSQELAQESSVFPPEPTPSAVIPAEMLGHLSLNCA